MEIGGRTRRVARISTEEAEIRLKFMTFIVSTVYILSWGYRMSSWGDLSSIPPPLLLKATRCLKPGVQPA